VKFAKFKSIKTDLSKKDYKNSLKKKRVQRWTSQKKEYKDSLKKKSTKMVEYQKAPGHPTNPLREKEGKPTNTQPTNKMKGHTQNLLKMT